MMQINQEQPAVKVVKVVMQTNFVLMFFTNKNKSIILLFNKIRLNCQTFFFSAIKHTQFTSASFALPFILSKIDINVADLDTEISQISYGVFLISLVGLICFINVFGFMLTYIIIQRGNYENKYPKLKKIINYYKNTTLVFVVVEGLLCLTCLSLLTIFSFLLIWL